MYQLPSVNDFDIIYLGHYYGLQKGKLIDESLGKVKIYQSERPLATHAYMCSLRGCKKLVDYFLGNRSKNAIDVELAHAIKNRIINSYTVYPNIVDQNKILEYNSIIDIWRNPKNVNRKYVEDELAALDYSLKIM